MGLWFLTSKATDVPQLKAMGSLAAPGALRSEVETRKVPSRVRANVPHAAASLMGPLAPTPPHPHPTPPPPHPHPHSPGSPPPPILERSATRQASYMQQARQPADARVAARFFPLFGGGGDAPAAERCSEWSLTVVKIEFRVVVGS